MPEGQPDKEKLVSFLERDRKIKDARLALFENAPEKINKIWGEIAERIKYLKNKYDDYNDRAVFQALAGGSFSNTDPNINEEDFPGEDSVVKFVEDLEKEYPKKMQE